MSTWRQTSSVMSWSVPYHVLPAPSDTGTGESRWIVGLHGMGEDADRMIERIEPFARDGWSLLCPRAPFPVEVQRRRRRTIGHTWYQYDGDADRFVAAMREAGRFLFQVLDGEIVAGTPVVLLGFSQGAYLAYTLGLLHPDRIRGVVGIAGRAKVEALGPSLDAARSVRILHVHGDGDPVVESEPCRVAIAALAERGLDARFAEVRAGHEFTPEMRRVIRSWLAETDWSRDDE